MRIGGPLLFAGLFAFSFWKMDLGLSRVLQGMGKLGWMFQLLFPPAHHGWLDVYLYSMLETLAMAFLGTFFAFLAAVPLGFRGPRTSSPISPPISWFGAPLTSSGESTPSSWR